MKNFTHIPIYHNAHTSLSLFFLPNSSKDIYDYYKSNIFYNLGIGHWKEVPKFDPERERRLKFNIGIIDPSTEGFTFCFSRHPLDRLVSAYHSRINLLNFFKKNRDLILSKSYFNTYSLHLLEKYGSDYLNDFNTFVRNAWRNKFWRYDAQYDFINEDIDFIGKFENLEQDLLTVQKETGFKPISSLKKIHVNKNRKPGYEYYFDDKLKDYASTVFKLDMDYFGYEV